MTALRRTVSLNGGPMRPLDLQTVCDQCNKSRAHGTTSNAASCARLKRLSGAHGRKYEQSN